MTMSSVAERRVKPLAAGLALFLFTGCATFQNTPVQDRTWAAGESCKAEMPPQCQIERVESDGRYWYGCSGTFANMGNFNRCMNQYFRANPVKP